MNPKLSFRPESERSDAERRNQLGLLPQHFPVRKDGTSPPLLSGKQPTVIRGAETSAKRTSPNEGPLQLRGATKGLTRPCLSVLWSDRACPELVEGAGISISPMPPNRGVPHLCAFCAQRWEPRNRKPRVLPTARKIHKNRSPNRDNRTYFSGGVPSQHRHRN
jgi:hypothetical protein